MAQKMRLHFGGDLRMDWVLRPARRVLLTQLGAPRDSLTLRYAYSCLLGGLRLFAPRLSRLSRPYLSEGWAVQALTRWLLTELQPLERILE